MSGSVVVVIDDEPEAADLVAMVLERCGHRVVCAADGEAGLEAVREHRPVAVVCDALLPRRSGFEVCRMITRDPELRGARVVLLSAVYRKTRYELEAADAGAAAFLAKPVEPAVLLAALAPALGGADEHDPEGYAAELELARARYGDKVPAKLDRAAGLVDRLGEGWEPEAASELRLLLHGLAGAGSTMGLARLGELARELEGLLDRLLERGRQPDAEQRRHLRRTLAVMRRAFA